MSDPAVQFALLACPLVGSARRDVLAFVKTLPAPWRKHGHEVITSTRLTSSRTLLVVCFHHDRGIVGQCWVSLPDVTFLGRIKPYSVIQHVNVQPHLRRRGIACDLITLAVGVSSRAGCAGVVAACGNSQLKNHLYAPLGFRPHPVDPWLLIRSCTGSAVHSDEPSSSIDMVRSASAHDVATVQSLCVQKHWRRQGAKWWLVDGQEYEEDFCCHGVGDRHHTSRLLVRSNALGHPCCGFVESEGDTWSVRFVAGATSSASAQRFNAVCNKHMDALFASGHCCADAPLL